MLLYVVGIVLSLGVAPGGKIAIRANGEDADEAIAALVDLVRRGFSVG